MNARLELLSILLFVAAAQGFFLVLLLAQKGQTANRWLALLLGLISIAILTQSFEINGFLRPFLEKHPHLYGIIDPFIWLIGPFYYFFIRSLTQNRKLKVWEYALHFFPFFLKTCQLIPFYSQSSVVK